MMPRIDRRLAWLLVLAAPLWLLPSGCAYDPGYGYGGGPEIGVGVDYYEPFGFDYGGWGGNYRTGPPRGGPRSFGGGSHAYRSAPASHAMPSIPSGPRGGGFGGARGGGAGGGRGGGGGGRR